MLAQILLWIITLFALTFLIVIHELGHLLAALAMGARVVRFSIGFGKSIIKRTYCGIEWSLNLFLVGGGVEIDGLGGEAIDKERSYYGLKPWKRCVIVIAGPLVNLLFALGCFAAINALGGRVSAFEATSQHVGRIASASPLYRAGLRSGDLIKAYDGYEVRKYSDHILAALMGSESIHLEGVHYDWGHSKLGRETLAKWPAETLGQERLDRQRLKGDSDPQGYPFDINVKYGDESHSEVSRPQGSTQRVSLGVVEPASVLLVDQYAPMPHQSQAAIVTCKDGVTLRELATAAPCAAPCQESDIGAILAEGDQIVWVNGRRVFSKGMLEETLNDGYVHCLVQRDAALHPVRIATRQLQGPADPSLTYYARAPQLFDLIEQRIFDGGSSEPLRVLSCLVDPQGTILERCETIDQGACTTALTLSESSPKGSNSLDSIEGQTLHHALMPGDRIVAAQGASFTSLPALIDQLQRPSAQLIVLRSGALQFRGSATEMARSGSTKQQAFDRAAAGAIAPSDGDRIFAQIMSSREIDELALSLTPSVQNHHIAGMQPASHTPSQALGHLEGGTYSHLEDGSEGGFQREFYRVDGLALFKNRRLYPQLYTAALDQLSQSPPRDISGGGLAGKDPSAKESNLYEQLQEWAERHSLGVKLKPLFTVQQLPPQEQARRILSENSRILHALAIGQLNPKWLSGPVGIFSVLYQGGKRGGNIEMLYWVGLISFGIALFNLLPIPALDGGHLLFNLFDALFPGKVDPRLLDRIIAPFVIMLIGVFIFVTYWDLIRLFD